jgi:hypothetical protein
VEATEASRRRPQRLLAACSFIRGRLILPRAFPHSISAERIGSTAATSTARVDCLGGRGDEHQRRSIGMSPILLSISLPRVLRWGSSWSKLRRRRSSRSLTSTAFPAPWRLAAAALAWRYALLASASGL